MSLAILCGPCSLPYACMLESNFARPVCFQALSTVKCLIATKIIKRVATEQLQIILNKVSPPRMFFILLFPSISVAQYDMNPGNFGVIEFLIFLSNLGGDRNLNPFLKKVTQNLEGYDQLPRGVQSPIKTAK